MKGTDQCLYEEELRRAFGTGHRIGINAEVIVFSAVPYTYQTDMSFRQPLDPGYSADEESAVEDQEVEEQIRYTPSIGHPEDDEDFVEDANMRSPCHISRETTPGPKKKDTQNDNDTVRPLSLLFLL